MTKLLIEIVCPSTGRRYDFWLSKKMLVEDVIEALVFNIKHNEGNLELFSNPLDLILFKPIDYILDRKATLEQLGVQSGDTLILI